MLFNALWVTSNYPIALNHLLLWGLEQVEQEQAAKESALERLAEMEQRLQDAGIDSGMGKSKAGNCLYQLVSAMFWG